MGVYCENSPDLECVMSSLEWRGERKISEKIKRIRLPWPQMPHYRHDYPLKCRKIRGDRSDNTVEAVSYIVLAPYRLIDRLLPPTAS